MKTNKLILSLTAIAMSAWVAGCKQEATTATETAKDATTATGNAVTEATDAVKKSVESAKETGAKVVADVKKAGADAVASVTEKAKEMTAPASAKAQELIDSAKGLLTEGKYADALGKLNDVSSASPSAEQQSVVNTLKAQIEKALAATSKITTDGGKRAVDAVNDVLKK